MSTVPNFPHYDLPGNWTDPESGNTYFFNGSVWMLNGHVIKRVGQFLAKFEIWEDRCECGLRYAQSGGLHSSWCPMKKYEKK